MRIWAYAASAALAASMFAPAPAFAGMFDWMSGDWYLKVGATGMAAPSFEGSSKYIFSAAPLVSLGKAGGDTRFSSRNDNISFGLLDDGNIRAGVTGKFLWKEDYHNDLQGIDPVRWGGELGGFFEFYPMDWMRARAELRHGIRAHNGFVADFAVDAFTDITPEVQVSAGPRLSIASGDFFKTYYGVTAEESARSGISQYDPGGGLKSIGFGGAIDWKATEKLNVSLFGEYSRLQGPAADSSIVRERGTPNQFTIGVSTTYRFDFTL